MISGLLFDVREQLFDAFCIAFGHDDRASQLAFAFGRFAFQQVAAVSLVSLDFAGTGFAEALRGAAMGFHFGHGCQSS
jgi:hypothetical protein